MTEEAVLTGKQSKRVIAALREMDAKAGCTIHYGQGYGPLCGAEAVRTY